MKNYLQELIDDRDYLITTIGNTFEYEQLIHFGARLYEVNKAIHAVIDVTVEGAKELKEVKELARSYQEQLATAQTLYHRKVADNHTLQLFIEENVSEEKKKEIFTK